MRPLFIPVQRFPFSSCFHLRRYTTYVQFVTEICICVARPAFSHANLRYLPDLPPAQGLHREEHRSFERDYYASISCSTSRKFYVINVEIKLLLKLLPSAYQKLLILYRYVITVEIARFENISEWMMEREGSKIRVKISIFLLITVLTVSAGSLANSMAKFNNGSLSGSRMPRARKTRSQRFLLRRGRFI